MKIKKIRASIIGGSGYGGSELLRFLVHHPHVELVFVTSRTHAGKKVSDVHKNLLKATDLEFTSMPPAKVAAASDVVFLAMPHGVSMGVAKEIVGKAKIIDLSGDFRLADAASYDTHYGHAHKSPALLKEFTYGLTELNKSAIKKAQNVACPGCFPTGALIALAPLAAKKLLPAYVAVDSKTGSSGSGSAPSAAAHHPSRANNVKAYKVFSHQHEPEIVQELAKFGSSPEVSFITHSVPMVRGIFTTIHFLAGKPLKAEELKKMYASFYKDSFFVRVVDGSPESSVVAGTNFADISVSCKGKKVAVMCAIDNLVKGAAGQAIQDMNLMFGLDEKAGLLFPGTNP